MLPGSDLESGTLYYTEHERSRIRKEERDTDRAKRARIMNNICNANSVVSHVKQLVVRGYLGISFQVSDEQYLHVGISRFQSPLSEHMGRYICPVYLIWSNGETHMTWVVCIGEQQYRVEPHGTRPDLNTNEILEMFPSCKLSHDNDVQPINYGICRLASLYALIEFLNDRVYVDEQGLRWIRPMNESIVVELNELCMRQVACVSQIQTRRRRY